MTHEEMTEKVNKKIDILEAEKKRLIDLKSNNDLSQTEQNEIDAQIELNRHELRVLDMWRLVGYNEIHFQLAEPRNITQEKVDNFKVMVDTLQWLVDLKNEDK